MKKDSCFNLKQLSLFCVSGQKGVTSCNKAKGESIWKTEKRDPG